MLENSYLDGIIYLSGVELCPQASRNAVAIQCTGLAQYCG